MALDSGKIINRGPEASSLGMQEHERVVADIGWLFQEQENAITAHAWYATLQ